MFEIALVGAGSLGRRHIEGLLKLPCDISLSVVDPSGTSLDLARRVVENSRSHHLVNSAFHTSVEDLTNRLDYAVIATSADVRLGVIEALLNGRLVKSMLLEKVLFQRRSDYATAAAILKRRHVRAWVNTPRRAMEIHQQIKKFFDGDVIRSFDVRGGEWGLGCNGIHFLDFLSLLTGLRQVQMTSIGLDRSLINSKRPGFSEFTGTLRGSMGSVEFALTAMRGSTAPLLTSIRSDNKSCILDETSGRAFLYNRKDSPVWKELHFHMPLVSVLSTDVALSILTDGQCLLPDFDESTSLHLPLIECLADFNGRHGGGDPDLAPIT